MASGAVDALVVETFGWRLLAYLLGVGLTEIRERLEEGVPLSEAAEAVLANVLVPLAETLARERAENPGLPAAFALERLGRFDPAAGMTVGSALRAAAGGDIPDPMLGTAADSDAVKMELFRLARDAYPQLLAPVEDAWGLPRLMFFHHPGRARLDSALIEDDVLSRLYPEEDPGLGRRGVLYNSIGRGGSIQSVMFGETLISAAWDTATLVDETPSMRDLLMAIDRNVDVIRQALDGGQPHVRALLVFTGIALPDGRSVETAWGTLRPLNTVERDATPAMLEGRVSGTDHDGKSVTVSYGGEVVLETTLPYELVVRSWSSMTGPLHDFPTMTGAHAMRRAVEGIALAVLLSIERPAGSWATARLAWQWVADPLSQGRAIAWNDTPGQPAFMPYELSAGDCVDVAAWTTRLESGWKPQIDIAVRRVLSAAHVRTDAADRLVDAVIAWENLFGTSEGEPRLRVSSAMAWLLESDPEDRASRYEQIKRLYDDRSKIVHGAKFDERALGERANEALMLARTALQILFRDRVDILDLRDGAARSLRLILSR